MSHGFSIYHNLWIKASAKKVFDAITLPTHLNNWWPLRSSRKPELNSIYNLNFTDTYDWYGKVVNCIENKEFSIKMTQSDEDWNSTTFGFSLEEQNNRTYLRFSHIGWPHNNDHLKHSSFC